MPVDDVRGTKPGPAATPPLVTVVTVALNAGEALGRTMDSVLSQTYPAIEYIVIDGGSRDGSVRYIEAHRDRLAWSVSEPDRGIYHAMNKGIARAGGEWIVFMNAGDGFAKATTVEQVLDGLPGDVDFIYGDVEAMSRHQRMRIRARPLEVMWQRISFSHQSLFTRTAIMKAHMFDLSYRVTADYAFYFKLYCDGARFHYVPMTIAVIAPDGFSERLLWRRTFERWRAARTYRPRAATDLFYVKFIATRIIPLQARRLLKKAWKLAGGTVR